MQVLLCSKQKQMQDYFQSSPRAPTPSKEPRARTPTKEAKAPTPIKDVSFKTVADVTKDVSLVDSLDMDDMELESIDTTIASVAASALMKKLQLASPPLSALALPEVSHNLLQAWEPDLNPLQRNLS